MITIAVVVGLMVTIWLAVRYRGFRWLLAAIPVGLLVAYAGWQTYDGWQDYQRQVRVQTLIKPDEIDIRNAAFALKKPSLGRREANLKFNLTNRSDHTLQGLTLRVTLTNCDADGANCEIAGVADMPASYLFLAPGKDLEVKRWMTFKDLPPLKTWHWKYDIAEIRAKVD